jgi:hypothetical protein
MLLSEVIKELRQAGFDKTGEWEMRGRKGIFLGDPKKYFPHQTLQDPQYVVDCTKSEDPDLSAKEITIIRRRFKKRGN